MLKRQSVKNGFVKESEENFAESSEVRLNEWKAAAVGLFLSLCVISTKTFLLYKDELREVLWEKKYVYVESILPDGRTVGRYFHEFSMKTDGILVPLLCGLAMTLFTWIIIYLDSDNPGVRPPTPFSPNKYKMQSGHSFHLGYIISVANGLMVFALMIFNNFFNS